MKISPTKRFSCKYQVRYLELLQIPQIQAFVTDRYPFNILIIPLVDKSLTFCLYRIHSIILLHPVLDKSFQCEIDHCYFEIRPDLCYIIFPDDENLLNWVVSSGHFCRLDTALHPINEIQE